MPKKKLQLLTFVLIEPDSDAGRVLYTVMKDLIDAHHEDLVEARIALAWSTTWQPDVDGRVTLGKMKRASDLDRELMAYDFVMMLQQEFFQDPEVSDAQRRAIIDHELCHGALKHDSKGEPVVDERGRKVYRIRKHDIEEFSAIVERHGCYKRDIEDFAAAIRRSKQGSLLDSIAEANADVRSLLDKVKSGAVTISTGHMTPVRAKGRDS